MSKTSKAAEATGRFVISERGGTSTKVFETRGGEPFPSDKKSLLERAEAAHDAISDEEDAALTAAARADPENPPFGEARRSRGRPPLALSKQGVHLRLDPEVIARFKADGPGWQTRMNEALRKAVGLD